MHEVIIVGAGLAGLAAAVECQAKGLMNVVVLEASTRVGGRVWTTELENTNVDWGAEWIIPDMHHEVMALVVQGKLSLNSELSSLPSQWNIGNISFKATYNELRQSNSAFERALQHIEKDAQQFLADPNANKAPELSLRQYLGAMTDDATIALLEAAIFPLTGAEPQLLSSHMLWYEIGFHEMSIHDTLNADACRIQQGCGALAEVLRNRLNGGIHFGKHVSRVTIKDEFCEIACGEETYYARHVISAVPLMTLKGIHFEPPLPQLLQETASKSNAGRVAKAWAVGRASTPPLETLNAQSPLRYGYARQIDENDWLLCGQILSDTTANLNAKDAAHLLQANWPNVEIISTDIVDWPHDPLACASWHSSRVGWAEKTAAFQNSIGNLHFAGGDIAPQWAGWMEGALLSGKIVAQRIASSGCT